MSRKSDIIVKDGQEFVETEDHLFGLGLQLPVTRTLAFSPLSEFTEILSWEQIHKIVDSEEFEFGQKMFDSSWITNQNGFGSCASYAGATALSKSRVINGQDRQDLSGDYLYSLVNGGRDQGSMLDDNMMALMTRGVALASTVPLGGIYRKKYSTEIADAEALRFRAHEAYAILDEQSMATAQVLRIPVVVAIHVTNSWREFSSDDVLSPRNNGPGNHSENCDDIRYNTKAGRFEYRKATSHGKNYSDDGYCWTYWDAHYKTPARYHQFYAIPSAVQDPQGNNPPGTEYEPVPMAEPILTVQTSDNCVWCRRWKETELPQAEQAGFKIMSGHVANEGVPAFELRVGDQKYIRVGFWRFSDIALQVAKMR